MEETKKIDQQKKKIEEGFKEENEVIEMYGNQRYDLVIIWCIILCITTTMNIIFKELIFKKGNPQFLPPIIAIPINLALIVGLIHAKNYKKSNIKCYLILKNLIMIGSIDLGHKVEEELTTEHY